VNLTEYWNEVKRIEASLTEGDVLHITPIKPPLFVVAVDRRAAALRLVEGTHRIATADEVQGFDRRHAIQQGDSIARAHAKKGMSIKVTQ
jgi:hypothetical protein